MQCAGVTRARQARTLSNAACKQCTRCLRVRASQEPDASSTETMSVDEACETLNVSSSSNFDTIMGAKNSQLRKAGDDQDKVHQVRARQSWSAPWSKSTRHRSPLLFAPTPVRSC